MILENLPNHASLRNLARASPDYHAVYLSARHVILTRVTFRELWARAIDLSKTEALVRLKYDSSTSKLDFPDIFNTQNVVKSTLRQLRLIDKGLGTSGATNGKIVLDVEQCLSLLTLAAVIWIPTKVTARKKITPPILGSCSWIVILEYSEVQEPLAESPSESVDHWMAYLDDVEKDHYVTFLGPRPPNPLIKVSRTSVSRWNARDSRWIG